MTLPCDRRYRNSQYFLEDQLRCSAAAEDFRSVKRFLHSTAEDLQASPSGLHLQMQTVPLSIQQTPPRT